MPWQDRLKNAVYRDQNNVSYAFDFTDLSRTIDKRTTAFSFPGINNNYVQDNGYGSRQYAMRCIFWGDDCDKKATEFEAALLLNEVGTLEHPLYGTFKVVPFGRISRRDDLVNAANQAIVDVTFWTTTEVVYPSSEVDPKNEVLQRIKEYKAASAAELGETLNVDFKTRQQEARGTVEARLREFNSTLREAAETTEEVTREFRAWQQTINTGINVLVGNPVLLAQQSVNLILAPARAVIGIQNRLSSYILFTRSLFSSKTFQPWLYVCSCSNPDRQIQVANDVRINDLYASAALVGMALACVETEFRTKPEALSAADTLLSELATMAAHREQAYDTLAQPEFGALLSATDTAEAWSEVIRVVTLCAGYLVQISFTLAAERVTVLDRNRTILDLAAEFYGGTDEYLDFIINTNDLTGSEILELPRGAEIVWYPN